jgi:hypothetical protein
MARGEQVEQGQAGFGLPFEWDVPLFDGYAHRFPVGGIGSGGARAMQEWIMEEWTCIDATIKLCAGKFS